MSLFISTSLLFTSHFLVKLCTIFINGK